MSRKRGPSHLDVPDETGRRLTADRRRFSVRLNRDEGHTLSNRAERRAQASPYPPARVAKNRSPPPRSRSRSASIISETNPTEAYSSRIKPSRNRRSQSRTPSRRVHFTPEADNEEIIDPKDNATSEDPVISELPARKPPTTQAIQIPQHSKRLRNRTPGISSEHATLIPSSPAPARPFPPQENTSVDEEMSSGESEAPNDHTPVAAQTHVHPGGNGDIRSGIKGLLETNREAPVVNANTASFLESLLSHMNQDGDDRTVSSPSYIPTSYSASRALASPGPANLTPRVRPEASEAQVETTFRPRRTVRKFRSSSSEGETVWWESRSASSLKNPPHSIDYTVGDLYIHRNTTGSSIQIWICCNPNAWKGVTLDYDDKYLPDRVILGLLHPSFSDRRLKLRKNGEPSWITKQTCATNKSRVKGV